MPFAEQKSRTDWLEGPISPRISFTFSMSKPQDFRSPKVVLPLIEPAVAVFASVVASFGSGLASAAVANAGTFGAAACGTGVLGAT